MKKETKELIVSWGEVVWFIAAILLPIRTYLIYGIDSNDFLFVFGVSLFSGIPMCYLVIKSIKRREFRLKKPTEGR